MVEGILTAILIILFQIYLNSRKAGLNEAVKRLENKTKTKGEIIEPPIDYDNLIKK